LVLRSRGIWVTAMTIVPRHTRRKNIDTFRLTALQKLTQAVATLPHTVLATERPPDGFRARLVRQDGEQLERLPFRAEP
jgi:hypothetical protein